MRHRELVPLWLILFSCPPSGTLVAVEPPVLAATTELSDQEAGSLRELLLALDQQFWVAASKHDLEALDALFADDYLGIGIDGFRWTKAEILGQHARVRLGEWKRTTERELVSLNERAAVLIYEAAFRTYAEDGQPLDEAHQRLLSCWVRRKGRWQVAFSQVTAATGPAPRLEADTAQQ
jgi:hypothetical protein